MAPGRHLTHTTRELLARFFRVYPGFLVDDRKAIRQGFSLNCAPIEGEDRFLALLPAPNRSRLIGCFSARFWPSRA